MRKQIMVTTSQDIRTTILNLLRTIAPEADYDRLRDDENVREALGIDSYDFLNFAIAISETYDVEIPEADYGKLLTIQDMVDYVAAQTHTPA